MSLGRFSRIAAIGFLSCTWLVVMAGCMNADLAWDSEFQLEGEDDADDGSDATPLVTYAPAQLPAGATLVALGPSQVNVGECFGFELKLLDEDQNTFGLTVATQIELYEANNLNVAINLYADSGCSIALASTGSTLALNLAAGSGSYILYVSMGEPSQVLLGGSIPSVPLLAHLPVAISSSLTDAPTATYLLAGQMSPKGYQDSVSSVNVRFNEPNGLAADATYVYVSDRSNRVIRRVVHTTGVDMAGTTTTLSGLPPGQDSDCSNGSCDGLANVATWNDPGAMVYDAIANVLYVADRCVLRKVELSAGATYGSVQTIAGSTTDCIELDGTGTSARFSSINSLALATSDRVLFVGIKAPAFGGIRRINLVDMSVSTVISGISQHGIAYMGPGAQRPSALFWAEQISTNTEVKYLMLNGGTLSVNTGINSGNPQLLASISGDWRGLAGEQYGVTGHLTAMRWQPSVSEILFRKLVLDDTAATMIIPTQTDPAQVGLGSQNGSGFGTHTMGDLVGGIVACGSSAYLCIADQRNHSIRRYQWAGPIAMSTLAGPSNRSGYLATYSPTSPNVVKFGYLTGVVRSGDNAYVLNRERSTVQKVNFTVATSIVGVNEEIHAGRTLSSGTPALLNKPHALAVAQDGAVYVADHGTAFVTRLIRYPAATGTGTVLLSIAWPTSFDPINIHSIVLENAAQPSFAYLSDPSHNVVYRVAFNPGGAAVPTSAALQTVFGVPSQTGDYANTDASHLTPADIRFRDPAGLALSPDNLTLYVSDRGNHVIRAIDVVSNSVSTLVGIQYLYSSGGSNLANTGPALSVYLERMEGIAANSQYLFMADYFNSRILRMDLTTGEVFGVISGTRPVTDVDSNDPLAVRIAAPLFLSIDPLNPTQLMIANEFNIRLME